MLIGLSISCFWVVTMIRGERSIQAYYTKMVLCFYSLFLGNWEFQRSVLGMATQEISIEGQACFQSSVSRRHYRETGHYHFNGRQLDFFSQYVYEILSSDNCRVLFLDGSLFYELKCYNQSIHHLCGADKYCGTFKMDAEDRWQLKWSVKGPRKNYSITTRYFRL